MAQPHFTDEETVLNMKTLCVLCSCLYSVSVLAQNTNALSGKTNTVLLEQIHHGEYSAILEAGRTGDTNLIPHLQAQITGEPTDPSTEAAKMALAKLGVKKYLDETVAELNTTNSALFVFCKNHSICPFPSEEMRVQCAKQRTWETAFKKLTYIRNPSTVKVVAQFLYSTESFYNAPDVPPWSASGFAIFTLRQMVDNPPQGDDVKVWQQWWEKNKDKYP
jgi:hypothetical protein